MDDDEHYDDVSNNDDEEMHVLRDLVLLFLLVVMLTGCDTYEWYDSDKDDYGVEWFYGVDCKVLFVSL